LQSYPGRTSSLGGAQAETFPSQIDGKFFP
jgi:hypothetical protein